MLLMFLRCQHQSVHEDVMVLRYGSLSAHLVVVALVDL